MRCQYDGKKRPRLQGRLHHWLWGLVLLAIVLGCSPNAERGSGCTGRKAERAAGPEASEEKRTAAGVVSSRHPAFAERVAERERMVASQIQVRGVRDPNVLRAMRTVPRHAFIPVSQRGRRLCGSPVAPIGHEQTISQPYVVAFMTEALALDSDSVVLEIGTGSGYQAAVCAEIVREVYSIEIVEPLAKSAAEALAELGYDNVHVRAGDGYYGWPEKGPFDAIIGTAAATEVPPASARPAQTGRTDDPARRGRLRVSALDPADQR